MHKTLTFEVHGKVQGVFFRKHTVDKAQSLGVVGWVANSKRGTVVGEAHGDGATLQALLKWLESEGSPASRVERVDARITEGPASGGAPPPTSFERRPNVP